MAYIYLSIAVVAELIATSLLKYSDGFTKLAPTIACAVSYGVCYGFFSKAVSRMNLSVAYAIWCGVGIVGTTLISFLVFKEKLSFYSLTGIFFIMIGCIILNTAH